jgi:sRNA-binding protein
MKYYGEGKNRGEMNKERRKRYRQRRALRLFPEVLRGMKEAREAIATLQSLWPAAFPDKFQRVRPLASGLIPAIAERTGWSRSYARGVVHVWKVRTAYCKAVLNFATRFDLNGEPVDQTVEDIAREQARRLLAARKARMAARKQDAAFEGIEIPKGSVNAEENSEAAHLALAS